MITIFVYIAGTSRETMSSKKLIKIKCYKRLYNFHYRIVSR